MYEGDILDFDSIEDLEDVAPIKSNRAIKKAAKKAACVSKTQPEPAKKSTVSTKPVDAICNKCNNKVVGELISDLYMPHLDKVMPIISYSCTNCGHVGRRSVFALALPLDQYERKYFN
jgi:BRCT domain type II-containing protein